MTEISFLNAAVKSGATLIDAGNCEIVDGGHEDADKIIFDRAQFDAFCSGYLKQLGDEARLSAFEGATTAAYREGLAERNAQARAFREEQP